MAVAVEELNERMMVNRNDIPNRVPDEILARIEKLRDEATSNGAVRGLMYELARRRSKYESNEENKHKTKQKKEGESPTY